MSKLRVGLMMGGISGENYLSKRSARQIFDHADRNRYDITCLEWKPDGTWIEYAPNSWTEPIDYYRSLMSILDRVPMDIAFVAFNGDREGDGRIAALFELMDVPYTGNGFFTSFSGMNKYVSKVLFKQIGLNTPEFVAVTNQEWGRLAEIVKEIGNKLKFPVMLKPAASGSSLGIEFLESPDFLLAKLNDLLKHHSCVLVEEFIKGREFCIGVMGARSEGWTILPIAEITYSSLYFDQECKYNDQYTVVVPVELPKDLEERLKYYGVAIHEKLMFEGLSRTDVIVAGDKVYVLEVNTHPGLGGHSIFPTMLRAGGIQYSDMIDKLIAWGLERHRRHKDRDRWRDKLYPQYV